MAKKVLFTSHTANFAKFNRPLMRDLQAQGCVVDYASAGEEKVADCNKHFIVPFARSPLAFSQHMRAYRELKKILLAEKYDLIHCHTPVGGVVTRIAAHRVRKQVRSAMIYTAHGFHFYKGASRASWLLWYPVEKFLARWTDCLVTINHEDYELAQRKFRAGRVELIDGVGVDLAKFQPVESEAQKAELRKREGLAAADFVLLCTGELNKNKNQARLIRILPALQEKIPEVKLLLAGVGLEQARLEQLVRELGLAEQVRFLGYRKLMRELYQLADVVVSVSQREGLGMNLIEGMAAGLPVVAVDNRGHREVIQSADCGMLVQTDAELRAAIVQLWQNPGLRRAMGQKNVQAAKRFALEKSVAKMRGIYRDYLKNF